LQKMKKSIGKLLRIEAFSGLIKIAKPYKPYIIVILVLSAVNTFTSLIPAYMMKPLTDRVFAPVTPASDAERIRMLNILLFALLAVYILNILTGRILRYRRRWLGEKVGLDLRRQLYTHLQRLSMRFYSLEKAGALHSRIFNDTSSIKSFVANDTVDFFIALLTFVGMGIVLLRLEWRLAVLLLIPLPLIIMLSQAFGNKLRLGYRKVYRKWANLSYVVFNAIKGVVVVKTNVTEDDELNKFDAANSDFFSTRIQTIKLSLLLAPLTSLIIYASGLMIRWVGGWGIIQGNITLGELMVFIGYMMQFYNTVKSISGIYANYQNTAAAGERVLKLLDTEPDILDAPNAIHLTQVKGLVRFDNVTFTYDGKKNVLKSINLEVKPRETIGVTGPSGAGKTTLFHLLYRLYDVSGGQIYIDEYEIRNVKIKSLRKQIGVLLQDTLLFYGSIAENIAYGVPGAGRIRIIAAAKAAGAHNFILQLPDAYDTIIGEGGAGLSGGERQRISIARLLLENPRILIFDEATSAVDLGTQALIQATIERLTEKHTIFIISQKPSMLKKVDRLIVFDNGRIVESGTYESLSKAGGLFNSLLEEKRLETLKERSLDVRLI